MPPLDKNTFVSSFFLSKDPVPGRTSLVTATMTMTLAADIVTRCRVSAPEAFRKGKHSHVLSLRSSDKGPSPPARQLPPRGKSFGPKGRHLGKPCCLSSVFLLILIPGQRKNTQKADLAFPRDFRCLAVRASGFLQPSS